MKRIGGYVLAAVLGGAAVYWFFPRAASDDVLTTCESSLDAEQRANQALAKDLDAIEARDKAACEERVDAMLSERGQPK